MSLTVSTAALRREVWQKELYKDVIDNLYFTQKGMIGTGTNNIVQIKDELKKGKGDTITFGLTAKLSGSGVSGDNELEGNEESISSYAESVVIDQKRFAVRLTGRLDEQMNSYDMRKDAKEKLSIQLQEFIERQFFFKLGGVNNTSVTDVDTTVVGADCAWSNAPAQVPSADTAACAAGWSGHDQLPPRSGGLLTPDRAPPQPALSALAVAAPGGANPCRSLRDCRCRARAAGGSWARGAAAQYPRL